MAASDFMPLLHIRHGKCVHTLRIGWKLDENCLENACETRFSDNFRSGFGRAGTVGGAPADPVANDDLGPGTHAEQRSW
jgi:hypothetical protein